MAGRKRGAKAQSQQDYAKNVAETLIKQLQEGTAPWQRPWEPGMNRQMPFNGITGKEYRGGNALYLWAVGMNEGYSDNRWMTYRQAQGEGAQVRKGEKGTRIQYVFWRGNEPVLDEQGKPVLGDDGKPMTQMVEYERPRSVHFTVFNAEQIDGLPPQEHRPALPEWQRHETAEAILQASQADIRHQEGNRAFYTPVRDQITLPLQSQFETADRYYATALHELGHWTGHESRLDRDLAHPFGSEGYAKEELRAEISSLMVGDKLGIGHDPGQHAAYVNSWVKVLQDDPREIFRAASDAEKITGYVMAFQQEQEQTQQQTQAASQTTIDAPAPQQGTPVDDRPVISTVVPDGAEHHAGEHAVALRSSDGLMAWGFGDNEARALTAAQQAKQELADTAGQQAGRGDVVTFLPDGKEHPTRTPLDGPVTGVLTYRQLAGDGTTRFKIAEDPSNLSQTVTVSSDQGSLRAVPAWALDPARRPGVMVAMEDSQMKATERTYLAVPFKEKDAAKKVGARWDREAKRWFAPKGTDLAPLSQWLPENRAAVEERPADPKEQFAAALREQGFKIEGQPVMDGNMQRVQVEGDKPGQVGGAYVGYLDGRPAGYIQNFRTGVKTNWKASGAASELTDVDRERVNQEAAEKRAAREAEKQATYAATSERVERELIDAKDAPQDHPYLVAKGLDDQSPMLKVDEQGNLMVPIHGNNPAESVWSVQRIGGEGWKGFEKGGQLSGGHYTVVRPNGDMSKQPNSPIIITEGWATAETIGRTTGAMTVTAFTAGNLKPVAEAMREKHPDRPIIIAGDNDHERERQGKPNTGVKAAEAAAKAVDGHAVIPAFEAGQKGSDWNDVAQSQGKEAVSQAMWNGMVVAERMRIEAAARTGHGAARVAADATLTQGKVNAAAEANGDPLTAAMSSKFTRIREKAERVEDRQDDKNHSKAHVREDGGPIKREPTHKADAWGKDDDKARNHGRGR